jgi:hypothetical protein
MLSPRRSAQLGLGAACLTLVTSITVLVAGSSDPNQNESPAKENTQTRHVAPLATGQLESLQADLNQPLASAKQ